MLYEIFLYEEKVKIIEDYSKIIENERQGGSMNSYHWYTDYFFNVLCFNIKKKDFLSNGAVWK